MQITVYNFAKEPNSTKQPANGAGRTITCVLKEDCSMMSPVFLLNGWQTTDNYVKWGSRYFWIEDIIIKSNDHAEYHCKEDVLASFKASIGASSQYITRSSKAYTPNLIDSKYPVLTSFVRTETKLQTLHSSMMGDGFYVVGIQNGKSSSNGGISYYAMTQAQFNNFVEYMYSGTWLDTTETNVTIALQKELINPMQYVSSIIWYPFSFNMFTGMTNEVVKFGWWEGSSSVTGVLLPAGAFVNSWNEQLSLPRHSEAASRGSYLNSQPFTRHTLFCYSFGQIPIDAMQFGDSPSIIVQITVDLSTGDAKLSINDANANNLQITYGKMGQQIQISQIRQSLISPITNIVSGAVGLAYGNAVGYGQGIISAVESMMPQAERSGGNDSRLWYLKVPTILTECHAIASEDKAHLGRPLCVRGTVSSYDGYIEIENADIEFACNFSELEEIKSFMESGFYYE